MKLTDFDYNLPKELIAQYPCEERDGSRLLVLHREAGKIEHRRFSDIDEYIAPNDALVLNDTKVFPARLMGLTADGKKVELLLLRQDGEFWRALAKPSSRLKEGVRIEFGNGRLYCEVVDAQSEQKLLRFSKNGTLMEIISEIGQVPLPPYIKREAAILDNERYQTVYAKNDGAVAAPTAGLHFTGALIDKIRAKGAQVVYVTLHVGYGTFKPVRDEDITKHIMHEEYYEVSDEAATNLNKVKSRGGRILAVGTTSCRVLEAVSSLYPIPYTLYPKAGYTDLFIYSGYKFKFTDALLTNFHLPKTTLLMLVCAFAGRDVIRRAYEEAVKEKYRFYSYGDAMLIL